MGICVRVPCNIQGGGYLITHVQNYECSVEGNTLLMYVTRYVIILPLIYYFDQSNKVT